MESNEFNPSLDDDLLFPAFMASGGVRMRDWVSGLMMAQSVSSARVVSRQQLSFNGGMNDDGNE